ncbi:MAG: T9SS type A sorting domain-containing protein [Bacteroidota bacterium]
MKQSLLTIASVFTLTAYAQSPNIQWQNIIAGNDADVVNRTIQSTGGNFYSVGQTHSTSGNMNNYHGAWDGWISKIDVNGNFVWKKPIGGAHHDYLTDIIQTSDGNYIACGTSYSDDGDLSGLPYSTISKNIWLIKFNDSGILWQQKYGGSGEVGYNVNTKIKETSNGHLHVFANSNSNDHDIVNHFGSNAWNDIVYFELDATGAILSQKNFGGSEDDNLGSVTTTSDGGFVILGTSRSLDFDVSQHLTDTAFYDTWIFKIDGSQNMVWEKSFLVSTFSSGSSIKELTNHNFIFNSLDSASFGQGALTVLSPNGNLLWRKTYGGSSIDKIDDVTEISPNSIFFSGHTYSVDGDLSFNLKGEAIWVAEIDSLGNIKAGDTYGGSMMDDGATITKTNDNSLLLSCGSSSNDYDFVHPYMWSCWCAEAWIVKLKPLSVGIFENDAPHAFSLYPNPASEVIHVSTSANLSNELYTLVNALGQTVLSGKLEHQNNTIDIQQLTPGFYSLQIGNDKQAYKIIKN